MLAGWQGERGEWAAASRFHSLCVSLFDQASPGPQEDGFDTSSRRTKRPLSVLSPPRPAVTHRHPLDKQRRGLGSGPQGGLGGSIKGAGDTFSCEQTPTQWQFGAGCHRDGGETECSAGSDKGREGSGITGRWRLKSFGPTSVCLASQTPYAIEASIQVCANTAPRQEWAGAPELYNKIQLAEFL